MWWYTIIGGMETSNPIRQQVIIKIEIKHNKNILKCTYHRGKNFVTHL